MDSPSKVAYAIVNVQGRGHTPGPRAVSEGSGGDYSATGRVSTTKTKNGLSATAV